ncbi:putative membrane protein [Streptomyces ambofaciens ATCC 23877]|uniref:Putative membrane protein n=1 Tax=Streptomyces ambofaciens (strain ATCC 23877 / 3486 / DSM 40053 / JCM 4204 / NBRC 12836 / NRRL B-2516) TaxID=278992 RepID=A0AE71_STRA7|nr:type IV secretory system conjugative DNA transfer family protein [Streptomyces ambofaciens]AKZ59545.1 putative membrane protein [Streptomyces ambofaciens ATCC 23877]CAJ88780.1 putative membrane protein [Streptomyces ambofaciens ATCC 23877]
MMTESDRAWAFGGIVFGGAVTLSAASWAGAAAGAVLTGDQAAPASPLTVYRMATDWSGVWAHSQTASAIGAALVDVAVVGLIVWGLRWSFRWFRNPSSLATLHQVRELAPKAAARTAIRLRVSLRDTKPKEIPARDRGVLLGDHLPSGVELRGSDEDTYVAIMAPRAGKSTSLAIPVAEEAPAGLLMTSNKADVYAATLASRSRVGHAWILDTQGVAQTERAMWWDMIAQAETLEGAERLASHFITQITSEQADPFWSQAAGDLLVGLFRAAYHDGGTVRDVMKWLADPREKAPMRILYDHEPVLAEQVESSINIAEETQSGIFQNARTAVSALRDERVLAWVTPDKGLPRFDPEAFATSRDTLYLLSKKGGPASAVVAALADSVFTAAAEAGERHGGRLPEPMRAVLDEAANICRIADLPDLYSHLGSRGITPYVILQSYRQGVKAWGEVGMDAMWSAATKKLIGVGLDDAKFAQDVSTLTGAHFIDRGSYSKSKEGYSYSVGEQREQVMDPAEIRAMKKGTALLMSTGMPVAQISLRPWYAEKALAHIGPQMKAEEKAITGRAVLAYEEKKAARRGR